MGLGGCFGCIKYLMFAFNFLFWLIGCAILGFGIWVRVDPQFHTYASDEEFGQLYTGAYLLIAVGSMVMVMGFLGCCGAIRESQCMLALFFVCLFLIFAILLAGGIWAIVSKDSLRGKVTTTLQSAVANYNTKENSRKIMDHVQTEFNCCGADKGLEDYGRTPKPATCLLSNAMTPCDNELFAFFRDKLIIIAGVAIGIGVVMLMGMMFSCCLCCAIRSEGRKEQYRYT